MKDESHRPFILHPSAFILLLALACAQPQQPPPEIHRVVSLAPNITEMIAADGCAGKIAGTDDFSDFPESVRKLPKVGGVEPDIERIVALHPDLVIASASNMHPNLRRALEAAHLPLRVIRTDRVPQIVAGMKQIGALLGCAGTRSAVVTITTALERQRRTRAHPPRVLFAVWTDPLYVAGRATFVDDLLALTGAQNDVEASGWPQYSLEMLAANPPDLILYPSRSVSAAAVQQLLRRAGTPAATRVQAVGVDEDEFTHPGPRLVDAAAQLNGILDRWERTH